MKPSATHPWQQSIARQVDVRPPQTKTILVKMPISDAQRRMLSPKLRLYTDEQLAALFQCWLDERIFHDTRTV